MTDMEAINKEAHRRVKDTARLDTLEYAEAFANHRDQLIKEGWTPMDEAVDVYNRSMRMERVEHGVDVIRAALAKARAHPADVVEAAKAFKAYPRGMACEENTQTICDYLLKDAP